ncbi:YTH-domain-containing protein [Apiospora aurea]|uniref:YTH-domain-containing protein n=1 Tax=Apiospora aurea TaxID=335848 RepID=A0ABR1PXG3_9PEZI
MASYSENPQQQQDADRDLDDWLHLTGWHNVADRNAKLAQFRDIHYDYETRRRELMRGTFDDMPQGQGPYESSQNIELAGNAGNERPPQQQQQQQFTLPIRPAPGAHHQTGPAGPSGPSLSTRPDIPTGPARPAVPTGPRARERTNRSRSRSPVLRGRSPAHGRSQIRGRSPVRGGGRGGGRAGGAAGSYRQRDYPEPRRPAIHPIREVDLGDWDDTRFFMIKSNSLRNIFACHDDNLWATSSVEKGNMLSDAYMTTKNVILFFSANGSQAIQGYVSRFFPRPLFRRITTQPADPRNNQWHLLPTTHHISSAAQIRSASVRRPFSVKRTALKPVIALYRTITPPIPPRRPAISSLLPTNPLANHRRNRRPQARMIGPPSGNIAKPEWYPRFSHNMSEPFPVEWLSKNTCPDRPMKGLLNRLNRDDAPGSGGAFLPPTRSRDCQEVDGQCGRDMLEILKRNAESAAAGTGAGVAARAE